MTLRSLYVRSLTSRQHIFANTLPVESDPRAFRWVCDAQDVRMLRAVRRRPGLREVVAKAYVASWYYQAWHIYLSMFCWDTYLVDCSMQALLRDVKVGGRAIRSL